jgi:hypothetical protein
MASEDKVKYSANSADRLSNHCIKVRELPELHQQYEKGFELFS